MFKFLPVLIMLMIPACVCRGQTNSQTALLTRIEKSKPDTNKIALLLQAGKTFLLKDVQNRYSPDSAYILFNRARQLSNSLKSIEWQGKCLSAIGAYFFETNHLKEGKMAFLEAIECFKKEQQLQNEADCWSLFARAMPDSDINNNSIKINYFNKSRDVFLKIKDTLNAITQQKNIAECFARQNKPDTAEKILLQAIKHYKAAGYKNLHDTYDALAQIYGQEADLHHEFL